MAHITGGGLTENIPRSLPDKLCVDIFKDSWDVPEIFEWLQKNGNIQENDMFRIFNCGIGMVLIVNPDIVENVMNHIREHNYKCFQIGLVKNKDSNNSVNYL